MIGSALRQHETAFAALIVDRLGSAPCVAMQTLLESEGRLAEVKADPGPLGLDTLLGEIAKLRTVRGLGLPESVFTGVSDRLVAVWRSRAARMFPSDFAECAEPVRYTLLAALCWVRRATDAEIEPDHRHARRVCGRVRVHRASGVPVAAAVEEHRRDEAVRSGQRR